MHVIETCSSEWMYPYVFVCVPIKGCSCMYVCMYVHVDQKVAIGSQVGR